jgi:hypothetical protein
MQTITSIPVLSAMRGFDLESRACCDMVQQPRQKLVEWRVPGAQTASSLLAYSREASGCRASS